MSQADVLTWLQDHPGWHTRREMAQAVGRHPDFFSYPLQALQKTGEVVGRVTDGRAMEYRLA